MKQGKNHPTPSKDQTKSGKYMKISDISKGMNITDPPYYIILLRFVERSRTLVYDSTSN
jgi:hypothetical protein